MESQSAKQLASFLQWRRGRGRRVCNPLHRRIPTPIKYCACTNHIFFFFVFVLLDPPGSVLPSALGEFGCSEFAEAGDGEKSGACHRVVQPAAEERLLG